MKDNFKDHYISQNAFFREELYQVQDKEVKQVLHRSIVALSFISQKQEMKMGSGVLISKNIILTAAQNIYDKLSQTEYHSHKVYIGANGEAEQYYEIEEWRYPTNFKCCQKQSEAEFNYALAKLKKPIRFNQYLPFKLFCSTCFPEPSFKNGFDLFGFPDAYQNNVPLNENGKIKLSQYGGTYKKVQIVGIQSSSLKIVYKIATISGLEGCPVTVDDAIIAVHLGAQQQQNTGRLIDAGLITQLKEWSGQLQVEPFSIKKQNNCSHIDQMLNSMKTDLFISSQYLESISLVAYPNLIILNLCSNSLCEIDLALCPRLTSVDLQWNLLREIDVSSNLNLVNLQLWKNKLQQIDVSRNLQLTFLSLGFNQIAAIDLHTNTKLSELWLDYNNISNIDLSLTTELHTLVLGYNKLTEVDLQNNLKLRWLRLQSNRISSIDLTKHLLIEKLWLQNNCLTEIDLSNNSKYQQLRLNSNKLRIVALKISTSIPTETYIRNQKYTGSKFRFENQQSYQCRVVVRCQDVSKAQEIAETWDKKYKTKHYQINKYGCNFIFEGSC